MAREGKSDLVVYAEAGASGEVASKLMFLAPGRYRLGWRTVTESSDDIEPMMRAENAIGASQNRSDRLSWTISCPGLQRTPLATVSAEPTVGTGRSASVNFEVPADCIAQNLALQARIDSSETGVQWTVSGLSVRPIAASPR